MLSEEQLIAHGMCVREMHLYRRFSTKVHFDQLMKPRQKLMRTTEVRPVETAGLSNNNKFSSLKSFTAQLLFVFQLLLHIGRGRRLRLPSERSC